VLPKLGSCLFNDETNTSIIEKLKGIEGALNFEDFKHDQIVFKLPLSALTNKNSISRRLLFLRFVGKVKR
jgi:hypothetical protein